MPAITAPSLSLGGGGQPGSRAISPITVRFSTNGTSITRTPASAGSAGTYGATATRELSDGHDEVSATPSERWL